MVRFLRYALVGVLNTLVGLAFIWLGLQAGLSVYAANVLGYCVGVVFSFALNRRWTFSAPQRRARALLWEFACFLTIFAGALLVTLGAVHVAIGHGVSERWASLGGVPIFNVSMFLALRTLLYRKPPAP
jgi:putative flippase GtrA